MIKWIIVFFAAFERETRPSLAPQARGSCTGELAPVLFLLQLCRTD